MTAVNFYCIEICELSEQSEKTVTAYNEIILFRII